MSAHRFLSVMIATILLAGCDSSENAEPPVARFSHSCVEFVCTFDASETTNAGGGTLYYTWKFGDETSAGGRIATHAYTASGTMTVVLVASNSGGGVASVEKEIVVTGNPAAKYYNVLHDSFGLLLLMTDLVPSIHATGDALQDAVEVHGAPLGGPYSINCPAGGTVEVTTWTDANNSLTIDGSEALDFKAMACSFTDADDALTSSDTVRISGDFDSNSFSFGGTTTASGRFRVARASRWPIQGFVPITVTRTAGVVETISFSSTNLHTFRVSSTGAVELAVSTPIDLTSDFNATTGITGNLAVDFPLSGASYSMVIVQPLSVIGSAGGLQLQAGAVSITYGGDRIDVEPDADPTYLLVEVDRTDNGDIDTSTRFPQSVIVERLAN